MYNMYKNKDIEIYYNNDTNNLKYFDFFSKWVENNIKLLNLNSQHKYYDKIAGLSVKYNTLYPSDKIIKLEGLAHYNVDITRTKKISEETKNLWLNKKSILYYKLLNKSALYFWELNQKYSIIQKNYNHLYEININETISDSILLINDKYFPLKQLLINYIDVVHLIKG